MRLSLPFMWAKRRRVQDAIPNIDQKAISNLLGVNIEKSIGVDSRNIYHQTKYLKFSHIQLMIVLLLIISCPRWLFVPGSIVVLYYVIHRLINRGIVDFLFVFVGVIVLLRICLQS